MAIELARQLWTMGGGHALGAEAVVNRAYEWAHEIAAEDPELVVFNGKYSASIYLLMGYALELLIKSAFIAHGGEKRELGNGGIGHDLIAALEAAERQGFRSQAPNLREIVELLREPHLAHQFRYGGMDQISLPANLQDVMRSLHHLAGELQAIVYRD